ncbi:MAG: type IV pili methyl-accepting chemotaxis transducer N-terminal domain-containing protein, partial [Cyanobacteria bacterium J06632_19]
MKVPNNNNFIKTIFSSKKYRPFLISAGLFLCFDLGVLIPNYIFSTLLKKDAVSINSAGRQRMLTQKISKSLLDIKNQSLLNIKNQQEAAYSFKESQEELKQAYQLFDDTLQGFQRGKSVQGADGETVYLRAVTTERGKKILQEAIEIWNPYKEKLQPILKADNLIQPKDLE